MLFWFILDKFGIFSGEASLKNQDPDPNTGVCWAAFWRPLVLYLGILGVLGIPWGDGALTDLEGDRASSDSLEVKACRPIKTHAFLSLSFVFPSVTRFIGPAFSLKNLDPVNHQGGREEKNILQRECWWQHRSDLDSLEIFRAQERILRRAQKIQYVLYMFLPLFGHV